MCVEMLPFCETTKGEHSFHSHYFCPQKYSDC